LTAKAAADVKKACGYRCVLRIVLSTWWYVKLTCSAELQFGRALVKSETKTKLALSILVINY